jgi:hypothetical protein
MTTDQLSNPPAWVHAEMGARLADSHVVFVGIGDVAGYVEVRIREAVETVRNVSHVRVVAPDIASGWDGSAWAAIVPALEAEHRLEMTANEFLDLLAGAYVATALMDIRNLVTGSADREAAVDRFREAAGEMISLFMLHWFRGAAVRPSPGETVVRSEAAAIAVIALGMLAAGPLTLEPGGSALSDAKRHQVLLAKPLQPRSELERDARHRMEHYIASSGTDEGAPTFVICGGVGPLQTDVGLPRDVIDEGNKNGMVEGPLVSSPTFVDGASIVNQ